MIRVSLPATSANLGPGFDCLGIAMDLWNHFELRIQGDPGTVTVETVGEGSDWLPKDRTHLVAKTMLDETWPGMLPTDGGIHIRCENHVPCASGMGSSSTATLAGLIFASVLAARAVKKESVVEAVREAENLNRVLRRAIKLEGHGDNVAPALMGGFVLVVGGEEEPIVRSVPFEPLRVVVCVPEFKFLTTEARTLLPGQYSKEETIYNIGHSLAVVEALRSGDLSLLQQAMGDRVHEPHRIPHIPGALDCRQRALDAGAVACCLSGAGPGMLAFAASGHEAVGASMVSAFADAGLRARSWVLDAVESGARVDAV